MDDENSVPAVEPQETLQMSSAWLLSGSRSAGQSCRSQQAGAHHRPDCWQRTGSRLRRRRCAYQSQLRADCECLW